jgi:hypothetical protein
MTARVVPSVPPLAVPLSGCMLTITTFLPTA